MDNLNLNLLATLETLLADQNVTKAARLNLSQPAVSAQLNRLRDVFDDPLLISASAIDGFTILSSGVCELNEIT